MWRDDADFHNRFLSGSLVIRPLWRILAAGGKFLAILALLLSLGGCGLFSSRGGQSYVVKGKRYHVLSSAKGFKEKGLASWYGEPFHGRRTASGEVYDMDKISAAHKTLPLHTWVEVRNLENDRVMTLRINDRGPFISGRVIDLSRAAARELGVYGPGLARVRLRAITGRKAAQLNALKVEEQARPEAAALWAADDRSWPPAPSAGE